MKGPHFGNEKLFMRFCWRLRLLYKKSYKMTNSPFDPKLRKFCLPAEFLIKTAFNQRLEKPPFGNEQNHLWDFAERSVRLIHFSRNSWRQRSIISKSMAERFDIQMRLRNWIPYGSYDMEYMMRISVLWPFKWISFFFKSNSPRKLMSKDGFSRHKWL